MKKLFFTILAFLVIFTGVPASAALPDAFPIAHTDLNMPVFTVDALSNPRGDSIQGLDVALNSGSYVNYSDYSTSAGPIPYETHIGSSADIDAFSERFWRPSPFH